MDAGHWQFGLVCWLDSTWQQQSSQGPGDRSGCWGPRSEPKAHRNRTALSHISSRTRWTVGQSESFSIPVLFSNDNNRQLSKMDFFKRVWNCYGLLTLLAVIKSNYRVPVSFCFAFVSSFQLNENHLVFADLMALRSLGICYHFGRNAEMPLVR